MTYFAAKPGMKVGDKFYAVGDDVPFLGESPTGWWQISAIYDDGTTEVSANPCDPPDNEAVLLMQGIEYMRAQ